MNFLALLLLGLLFHLLTSACIGVCLLLCNLKLELPRVKITTSTLLLGSVAVYLYVITSVAIGIVLAVAAHSLT